MGAGDSLQTYEKLKFSGKTTDFSPVQQRQQMSRRIVGIFVPFAVAGGLFSFIGSPDGVEWYTMQQIHGGGEYSIPASPRTYVPLDPRVVAGVAYLRIQSDADETGLEIMVSMRAID